MQAGLSVMVRGEDHRRISALCDMSQPAEYWPCGVQAAVKGHQPAPHLVGQGKLC